MGLDWFPSERPKPGHEAEYAQLKSLDVSKWDDGRRAHAEARLREISQSAFDYARAEGHWRNLKFRADVLREAVEVIGEPLLDRAWEPQTAKELAEYGVALQAAAQAFARTHHLGWADLSETPAAPRSEEREERAFAWGSTEMAARWCLWWSAKGFGLDPDY